jgi:hypothetical protein
MSAVPARFRCLAVGRTRDAGGAATGFIVAVLVLAAVAVGAFFYFGGEADVDVKNPDIQVSSDETPS